MPRKEYYWEHRDEILQKLRENHDPKKSHEYYLRNRQRILDNANNYRKTHIEEIRKKKSSPKELFKAKERTKKYNQRRRLECLIHYGGDPPRCACCGETSIEFLCIDHIKGGGLKHRREICKYTHDFFTWLIKNNYPEGFRILCYNCNSSLGHYGYCPHSTKVPLQPNP